MASGDISWPAPPTGICSVQAVDDRSLLSLEEALQEDSEDEWFEQVQPPQNPGPHTPHIQDYDHSKELAAVPDSPTEEYRQKAQRYIESELHVRDQVRPDSLRPLSEIDRGITRHTTASWVWYRTTSDMPERSDDRPKVDAGIQARGKYLFFTPNKSRVLEDIVIEQFDKRPFNIGKIPSLPNREGDAVLCLYYSDDRYTSLLRREYQNEPEDGTYDVASSFNSDEPVVKPRGFKTNEATRRGEYSDRFREGT